MWEWHPWFIHRWISFMRYLLGTTSLGLFSMVIDSIFASRIVFFHFLFFYDHDNNNKEVVPCKLVNITIIRFETITAWFSFKHNWWLMSGLDWDQRSILRHLPIQLIDESVHLWCLIFFALPLGQQHVTSIFFEWKIGKARRPWSHSRGFK